MDFSPETAFKYNNSGYVLLGYIIEKITQKSYQEFIENHIFHKLNMNSTYYGNHSQIISNRASGYQKRGNQYSNAIYISPSIPYAAGAIMSTTTDLFKWQEALKNNVLLKPKTLQKAYTNHILNNEERINYGYGWNINEINGISTREHGGRIFGFTSMGVYVPSKDIYVVILSNCSCNSPTAIAVSIAAMTLEKPYHDKRNSIPLSTEMIKKWEGTYTFENGVTRTIYTKDGKLYSQRKNGSPFLIYPITRSHFLFEDTFAEYIFSESNNQKQVLFKNRIKTNLGTINKP